jgi:hypothetical protein
LVTSMELTYCRMGDTQSFLFSLWDGGFFHQVVQKGRRRCTVPPTMRERTPRDPRCGSSPRNWRPSRPTTCTW